ncbi:MAG: SgcJ/EcaC family oxidoreductase [Actinomycetota bacterium]
MPTAADVTEIEALAARYGEAWNSQDLEAIVDFHAEDGLFHLHAGSDPVQGREAIHASFAAVIAQWPDIHFEEQRLIAAEDGWVLQSTMSGSLAQPLELEGSVIAQPGASIAVDALDLIEVQDGLITAKHTYLDSATLLRQLGVVS